MPSNLKGTSNMSGKLHASALAALLTLAAIVSGPAYAQSLAIHADADEHPWRNTHGPQSTDYALSGGMHTHRHGYGPATYSPAGRLAPREGIEGARPRILDCVHVLFPQCGDGG
jgi:hypothetical protein